MDYNRAASGNDRYTDTEFVTEMGMCANINATMLANPRKVNTNKPHVEFERKFLKKL